MDLSSSQVAQVVQMNVVNSGIGAGAKYQVQRINHPSEAAIPQPAHQQQQQQSQPQQIRLAFATPVTATQDTKLVMKPGACKLFIY